MPTPGNSRGAVTSRPSLRALAVPLAHDQQLALPQLGPAWPCVFLPHAYTAPSPAIATTCAMPAASWRIVVHGAGRGVGSPLVARRTTPSMMVRFTRSVSSVPKVYHVPPEGVSHSAVTQAL